MATRATGRVIRFGVAEDAVNIRLDIDASLRPLDNWFKLPVDKPNYNSLFSLVVASAANRWPLTIRATKEIVATEPAIVKFMVVGWEGGDDDD
jgi:hypothetical protein